MKNTLKAQSQSIALILATNGIPSEDSGQVEADAGELIVQALQTLEDLPVIIIVRLSTDDPEVRKVST